MVLVDWEIEEAIRSGKLGVDPFEPSLLQPNSLDVRLSSSFVRYQEGVLDPFNKSSLDHVCIPYHALRVILSPQEFLLASTMEMFALPPDITATIEGKSSLARLGVSIHQTGGRIDAGFRGAITLEICNMNPRCAVTLHAGMPIAQMVFEKTSPCRLPYDQKPDAKYVDQINATPSRYYLNEKTVFAGSE